MSKNLYDILGVDKNATAEEIKEAFRNSAKDNHPDVGGSAEKMAEANHAYSVLINPQKRERYDSTGEDYDIPFDERFSAFVNEVFMSIVEQAEDVDHYDLIEEFKNKTDQIENNIIKNKREYEKKLTKFNKVAKRIKTSKRDYISNVLQAQIDDFKKKIKACESDFQFIKSCKEILEGYNYEFDEVQEQPIQFVRINFSGSSVL